ncbi:MAG: hypothetical protein HRU25_07770 [Psychrobium sp.]|nr:hypothetical protein [Psychrobium sp.]
MAKIDDVNKLPKWFREDKGRYSWLRDCSLSHLAGQWTIRVAAFQDLEEGKKNSEHLQHIYDNYGAFEDDDYFPPYKGDVIWPLVSSDILLHAREISTLNPDPFDEDNVAIYQPREGSIIINIALADLTDTEVISQIQLLLDHVRPKLNIHGRNNVKEKDVTPHKHKAKKKKNMAPQIHKLRTGGIFECMDLFLWAEANGHEIKGDTFAVAVQPNRFDNKTISAQLAYAKEMVTERFTDLLELEIGKQNINS